MQKSSATDNILEKYKTDILTRYQYKPVKRITKDPDSFALQSFDSTKPSLFPKIENKGESLEINKLV